MAEQRRSGTNEVLTPGKATHYAGSNPAGPTTDDPRAVLYRWPRTTMTVRPARGEGSTRYPYPSFTVRDAVAWRMDRDELYDYWARRGQDRPAWVREHADELAEHTDLSEPYPPDDASIAEVREFLRRFKSAITKQLRPEDGAND